MVRWAGFACFACYATLCAGAAPHRVGVALGDGGVPVTALICGISCTVYALRFDGRERLAWLLFAAGSFVAMIGNAAIAWYLLIPHHSRQGMPSSAWVFPLFGPFTVTAVLLHHDRVGDARAWARLLLDAMLVAGSLFTLGWSVTLAEAARDQGPHPLGVALVLAYPVFDIVLASVIVALRLREPTGRPRQSRLVFTGLAVIVLCDTLWDVPVWHHLHGWGRLLATGWSGGYLLLGYAPWRALRTAATSARERFSPPPRLRRTAELAGVLVPYAAGAVSLGGLLGNGLTGGHPMDPVLLVVGGGVLLSLVARQAVTIADNMTLTRELSAREDHFRSLVQESSDVIMIVSESGIIAYVSPAMRRVLGHPPARLLGTALLDLVHPDDRERVSSVLDGLTTGGESTSRLECRLRGAVPAAACGIDALMWRHTESTLTRYRDGLILNSRDVSDRIALQNQLAHFAFHDALTGLANRALLSERIEQAIAGREPGDEPVSVLFLDLDGFKSVNDTAGHASGDALLVAAAGRLRAALRTDDVLARFGGDEFAVLLGAGTAPSVAREIAGRLVEAFGQKFRVNSQTFRVGVSIGLAHSTPGMTAAELLRRADLAMYQAKSAGKGRSVAYAAPQLESVPRPAGAGGTVSTAIGNGPDGETCVSRT